MNGPRTVLVAWMACIALILVEAAPAQEGKVAVQASDSPATVPISGVKRLGPNPEGSPATVQPGKPAADVKPGDAPKPGEQPVKPGEAAPPPGTKPTARPAKPAVPANPDELKVRPDKDKLLRFNFKGQPWLAVLEWLAEISGQSLDWQELPGDYLNLATQRAYTIDEARDLINRHLLDRGYTLLRHDGVLTVVNIKKLDPSLVPRVKPEDLAQRDPHEFVKVSFKLDWLLSETALEELKPMLSPNHKITPLKATNRIEAMDAVINLREVHKLLTEEQSANGQERLVREFKLQHRRAAEVHLLLEALLGLENSKGAAGGAANPQQMQQMMQQMMQQQQQQQQQQQGGKPAAASAKPKVNLVVNPHENSILAHAPADQMAIIEQAVKTLDVPSGRADSLLTNINRMQVYRLASIDPEPFVKTLEEMGNLDPTTTLKVDTKHRSIIAYASLADHVVIRSLIQKLDGSDRKFEVIRLKRLEADYVAGTIDFMMGGAEKKKQPQQNPFYSYNPFAFARASEAEDESKRFRVDADVEHNRLLLWANDIELQEIQNLLVKLGEVPAAGGNRNTVRVLDEMPLEEQEQLLERIRKVWPNVRPNPLKIVPPESPPAETPAPPAKSARPRDKPALPAVPAKETTPQKNPVTAAPSNPTRPVPFGKRIAAEEEIEERVVTLQPVPPLMKLGGERHSPPYPRGGGGGSDRPQSAVSQLAFNEQPIPQSADAGKPVEKEDEPLSLPAPRAASRPAVDADSESRAPVTIDRGPDGRLIMSSQDTQALDSLEDLLSQYAPPRRDYKVFHLKNRNTWAFGVVANLEKFFDVGKNGSGSGIKYSPYFGFYPGGKDEDPTRKLSKRRPLKFISDSDSHTIMVMGADPAQLKLIEELINVYDQPDSMDVKTVRMTKVFAIRYSKAKVIADAVKDVYRDLLSANDKALEKNQQQKEGERPTDRGGITYIFDRGMGDKEKEPEPPIKFKGLLSIGVDDLSNTLVVSASEGLIESVGVMIEALDTAAQPTVSTIQVLKVGRHIDSDLLQQKLSKLLRKPPEPPKPGQQPNQGNPQMQNAHQQGVNNEGQPVQENQ